MSLRSIIMNSSIAVVALLLFGGIALVSSAPVASAAVQAKDECFSQERCAGLRDDLRDLRKDARGLRREMGQLRRQLRDLPQDSPERERIREKIRDLRMEARGLRRESRPIRRDLREHCRGCFGDGTGNTPN
jgi:hypothetical protein